MMKENTTNKKGSVKKTLAGWIYGSFMTTFALFFAILWVLEVNGVATIPIASTKESATSVSPDTSSATDSQTAPGGSGNTTSTPIVAPADKPFDQRELPAKAYQEMMESGTTYKWSDETTLEITLGYEGNLTKDSNGAQRFFANPTEVNKFLEAFRANPQGYTLKNENELVPFILSNYLGKDAPKVEKWELDPATNVVTFKFEGEATRPFGFNGAEGFWEGVAIYLPV